MSASSESPSPSPTSPSPPPLSSSPTVDPAAQARQARKRSREQPSPEEKQQENMFNYGRAIVKAVEFDVSLAALVDEADARIDDQEAKEDFEKPGGEPYVPRSFMSR
ncbi:hypothetical protein CYLTODRAFT_459759 [Cylindrobasidium torrendii FP15055 ss-10]|uniref:Uncharacterized protein n=1 Tax=Cylindrobasidium torrendii FP15055 ss-10 TaxID=1314674 RepID=A0A0D7AT63_9AGAR|nr:hypothetical protein CYLTODRAFT_459759 [Cylindrobasidium torrendii FP15055 ss-10]